MALQLLKNEVAMLKQEMAVKDEEIRTLRAENRRLQGYEDIPAATAAPVDRSHEGYMQVPGGSKVQRIFDLIDLDQDGVISVGEFKKAFTGKRKDQLIPLISGAGVEWNEVFKQMDANSSGAIDIAELEAQIENVKAFNATFVDPIELLFNAIDLDQDGSVSNKEFQKGFQGRRKQELLGLIGDVGVEWKEVFRVMDRDGNGNVTLDEFRAHVDNVKAFSSTFA